MITVEANSGFSLFYRLATGSGWRRQKAAWELVRGCQKGIRKTDRESVQKK